MNCSISMVRGKIATNQLRAAPAPEGTYRTAVAMKCDGRFIMLARIELQPAGPRVAEGKVLPTWQSTHPDPGIRARYPPVIGECAACQECQQRQFEYGAV